MKPLRPSRNKLTQGYRSKHPAYDYSGRGDKNVYAANSGTVVQVVNKYNSSWLQGHEPDPTPNRLTTEDYGNYIKVRHDDGSYALYAHLDRNGTRAFIGERVTRGQIIGTIGHTGNSTAPHLHFEYRNPANQAVSVDFDTSDNAYQTNPSEPISEKPKDDMDIQPLLDKYNVRTLKELDDKIEQHVGTDWDGGFLGGDRRKVKKLEERLRKATSYAEEVASRSETCLSELEGQDSIIESLEKESEQLLKANEVLKADNELLHNQVETLLSENEKIRQEQEEVGWVGLSKELQLLLKRYTSRKMLLALLAAALPLLNSWFELDLDIATVAAAITPLMLFIGAEGWADVKRVNSKK